MATRLTSNTVAFEVVDEQDQNLFEAEASVGFRHRRRSRPSMTQAPRGMRSCLVVTALLNRVAYQSSGPPPPASPDENSAQRTGRATRAMRVPRRTECAEAPPAHIQCATAPTGTPTDRSHHYDALRHPGHRPAGPLSALFRSVTDCARGEPEADRRSPTPPRAAGPRRTCRNCTLRWTRSTVRWVPMLVASIWSRHDGARLEDRSARWSWACRAGGSSNRP